MPPEEDASICLPTSFTWIALSSLSISPLSLSSLRDWEIHHWWHKKVLCLLASKGTRGGKVGGRGRCTTTSRERERERQRQRYSLMSSIASFYPPTVPVSEWGIANSNKVWISMLKQTMMGSAAIRSMRLGFNIDRGLFSFGNRLVRLVDDWANWLCNGIDDMLSHFQPSISEWKRMDVWSASLDYSHDCGAERDGLLKEKEWMALWCTIPAGSNQMWYYWGSLQDQACAYQRSTHCSAK